jgi:hypothetical protein
VNQSANTRFKKKGNIVAKPFVKSWFMFQALQGGLVAWTSRMSAFRIEPVMAIKPSRFPSRATPETWWSSTWIAR